MPFIVQCPNPECKKYMLLGESMRGTVVECLICKKPIRVDPSASGSYAPPPARFADPSAAPQPAQRHNVTHCPRCSTPLRVPPHGQGQSIQCPRCKHVFKCS